MLGMPRKAPLVLPTADPVQDGDATAARVMPVGELALRLNEKTDPSFSVIVNAWPAPKTVALL